MKTKEKDKEVSEIRRGIVLTAKKWEMHTAFDTV